MVHPSREQHTSDGPTGPSVSVVVPLYNHSRFIAAALEGVLAQTRPVTEIIVIDDGSQDDSAAIVEQYADHHSHIVLWRQANQGAHHAINTGLHLSCGDYVAILNSDDIYGPTRLAECIACLEERPQTAGVATQISFMDDSGSAMRNPWYESARAFFDQEQHLALALANGNFVMTTSNLVLRRTLFREIGYFSALRYAHDLDFLLRMQLAGKELHILERPLLRYRIHSANTIKEDHLKVRAEWAAAVSFFAHGLIMRHITQAEDWQIYRRLLNIAEHHQLTRLMLLFLAHYGALPPGRTSSDSFLLDPQVMQMMVDAAS
jgi:glycosyltransferase involved in cell wall biosynthesis